MLLTGYIPVRGIVLGCHQSFILSVPLHRSVPVSGIVFTVEQETWYTFPKGGVMMNYQMICGKLRSLTESVKHRTANLANASALLYYTMENLNWAGFYLLEGEALILGPFQGKPACIEIPLGKGVCGTAAAEDRTMRVEDVHQFSGHIACDCASNSEIVIPLHEDGCVVGVLDIDSPLFSRFTEEDQAGLEAFAQVLEDTVFQKDCF